MLSKYYLFQVK